MNMLEEKLSKKYAKAFIAVFHEKLSLEVAERIESVAEFLRRQRSALFYVQLSAFDNEATKKKLQQLLHAFGLQELFTSLIDLLVEQKRISLLPRVMDHIVQLSLEKNNIMRFTIECVIQLTMDELVSIKEYLARKTGKKVICQIKRNPDLIAGLKVYSETVGFEQSIQKYLRALE